MEEFLQRSSVSEDWYPILLPALNALDDEYKTFMLQSQSYIPASENIFAAFSSLSPKEVKYILWGQDPYPRKESAIGYAFIDGVVEQLFSPAGLDKRVNRATSLRNFIKMALLAEGLLSANDLSQAAIAAIDKSDLIDSIHDLRKNFEKNGVLLLNMALLFTDKKDSVKHLRAWRPFVKKFLEGLQTQKPKQILLGNYAKSIAKLPESSVLECIEMEHPYNTSFITSKEAQNLFEPMALLRKGE